MFGLYFLSLTDYMFWTSLTAWMSSAQSTGNWPSASSEPGLSFGWFFLEASRALERYYGVPIVNDAIWHFRFVLLVMYSCLK